MNNKVLLYKFFATTMSTILCIVFCGCSSSNSSLYNSDVVKSALELATADNSTLTDRQKQILIDESLPTNIDELSISQKNGIMNIENAYLYLEEKYKGVEFVYLSHYPAGVMGYEVTDFVPIGEDENDERNIVSVEKDREGNYTDNYILVAVRKPIENIITNYVETYFGEENVKVYVSPYWTNLKYDDVFNENNVKGQVKSTATIFLPVDQCNEAKLDSFANTYKSDDHDFECAFRATIIKADDFKNLSFQNRGDMYDSSRIIYDINIE